MAKYKLTQKVFIAPYVYDAGTIVEYKGPPGLAFEPVDDEAKALKAEYLKKFPRLDPINSIPIGPVETPVVTAIHGHGTLAPHPNLQTGGTLAQPGAVQPDLANRPTTGAKPPPVLVAGEEPQPPKPLEPGLSVGPGASGGLFG